MTTISFINTSWLVVVVILVHLGFTPPLLGQEGDGMLIFQVDGNRYKRSNFNKKGKLINYQIIEIGQINTKGQKVETKMTVITYEPDGTLKDASQTKLICSPEIKQVLMGGVPFAGKKSKKTLVVKMDNGAIMYPHGWRKLSQLDDFKFSLNFMGGAVGFFGTESKISITNRKVMPLKDTFGVSGKMLMKAYVMRIRIATIEYDFFEEIDAQKGILYQKFTEKNGDYFTTEILK